MARWAMVAVAVAMVLDFFPARGFAMTPVACSPGLAVIRDDPEKGFGVLDLPSQPSGTAATYIEGNFYMLQQAVCHGRQIVQGNTSRDMVASLRDRLETSDLQAQRRQLAAARVKYIIMRLQFPWNSEDGLRSMYPLIYRIAYDDGRLMVLRIY
jgi:hypothetical protein